MTPYQWRIVGVAAALLVVVGALVVRTRLLADFESDVPNLKPPDTPTARPSATPTPGSQVVVLPPRPVASATPQPSAPPTPAPGDASPAGARVWLPFVPNDRSGPPFPLDLQLTPETTPSPTAPPQPTAAPPPTQPPTPTRGPLRVTKLGIGLYDSGGSFLPILDQIRPSVILLMDPTVDFAQEVRKAFPRAFIVGRLYDKNQPLDNASAQGAAFADRVAQKAVPLKGVVDAWMSYNEITGHDDYDNYRMYNAFQVAFARRLQDQYGVPAVAGNDGPGTVEPEDYAKYFAEAIRTSQYFGIHTYAPFGESSMRSPRSLDLTLRHRRIRDALVKAGIPVRKGQFVITEAGLWDGWRGVASEESMAQDFTWLAEELNKDDYVVGVAVFGLFASDRWQNFNIAGTSIIDRIGAYNTEGWHP